MKPVSIIFFFFFLLNSTYAQHDHPDHGNGKNKKDTVKKETPKSGLNKEKNKKAEIKTDSSHAGHEAEIDSAMSHPHHMNSDSGHAMVMYNAFSRDLPMSRTGSGTSWHTDNSPMFMNMWHKDKWNIMLHYGVFLNYTNQNIPRKSTQRGDGMLMLPDWVMAMANRPVGKKGLFMIRGMFSTDAIIMGGFGYPLLFQTGETWRQEPLVDRQHPHELISELAMGYSHAFNKHTDVFVYLAIPGEPSIGPPAFMHRPSALNIPSSPLGHHWQDATHIIFGVATLGVRYKNIKLEGSSFTGSEPDENRFDIDKPKFNSYSFRLSVNPAKSLALQTSYAYLVSPEVHAPGVNVERYTASVLHGINFGRNKKLNSSLIWGLNKELDPSESDPHLSNSFLLESNLLTNKYSFFTRIELIEKSFHELHIEVADEEKNNLINSYALGASRFIYKGKFIWIDIGAMGTFYLFDKDLIPYYGKRPYSADVFIRLIPAIMKI